MKRIHVVQMINALPFGGAERCVVDIVNNCDSSRFKFTVMVFKDDMSMAKQITNKDIEIILVPKKSKFNLFFQNQISGALKKIKPDVIHTHLFIADFWGRLAAKKLGIPVVTTEHNINVSDGLIRNKIKKLLREYSSKYIACSEAVKKYMQAEYSIRKNIAVIGCGIDLNKFESVSALKIRPPFKLVMIGRLSAQKGHAVALRTLAGLKKFNWRLSIFGMGDLETNLKDLAKKLKISDRVEFRGVSSDIPGVLERSQFMLMPSLWEGLGIVIEEGMAAGRVVIGSNVGGIPELIRDQETGYLVEPNQPTLLKNCINKCFENTLECERVANQARAYAFENFGIEKMIREYQKIYDELYAQK